MNKITSTALLLMLALANAGLDYSAVCVFLDVDPFGTFTPNNFFAGLVAVAQSLLLIILPWVASEKLAAGEKGATACALLGSLFVAMAGAFLRATTEAASTTTSVSGEVVSGLSIDGIAFVLIMAGIALGEAIAAFLIKSLGIRAEAEALQAEIERMRIIERHIDEDIATAARARLPPGARASRRRRSRASKYSSSSSRNQTTATTASSGSWTKSRTSARPNARSSPRFPAPSRRASARSSPVRSPSGGKRRGQIPWQQRAVLLMRASIPQTAPRAQAAPTRALRAQQPPKFPSLTRQKQRKGDQL